ncbi:imidazole glycerol phosphate synthase subunit HisH [Enteroscipio rubneri]|uniref:Imidazole glycerol phosphate synthase subunit HisH n=1 Tax=Enteroscipio rubneri TaxID=2070686 RepID=A0A2K2UAS0_9ACTN|nr:imidazole glycerol phosphate synthase subunit HisH [Enteroscipio rubneri]PNV67413.1 imidazole glycerol phosphate synthase subunit HisH [Enteroscipio rubneri]
MIAIVDYHKGNLKSVERGLAAAGGDVLVTDDAAAIAHADAVVLPGVGAFADAAATMQALGQAGVVRERIAAGVPFLGICLGMHLMFEEGVEGAPQEDDEASTHNACGLAVLPGVVAKMPKVDQKGLSYKVPHVGWNTVQLQSGSEGIGGLHQASSARAGQSCGLSERAGLSERLEAVEPLADGQKSSPLFDGIPSGTYFYFTHGFVAPSGPFVVGETTHSVTFPSAVQYGDVAFGVQFHPEKSSDAGARLLRNFVSIVKGA